MPRSTSSQLNSLLPACETQSTIRIALRDGSVKRLTTAAETLNLGGEDYLPGLLRVGELKETLGQPTNRVNALISNVDKTFGLNVASGARKTELSDVVIKRLYRDQNDPGIYEWKHFFTGKAVNAEVTEKSVSFDVIPDTTAAGTCIATETLTPNNGWKFPEVPDQSPPGTGGNPGGGIGGGGCFLAGTQIFTPRGSQRIETMKPNWNIYSFGEQTRGIEIDRVIEIFEHFVSGYFELAFSDGSNIKVTPEHPFLTEKDWIWADDLKIGENVWRFIEGVWRKVSLEKIKWIREVETVFNLHVERNRNYFANRFAVHNKLDPWEIQ